MSEFPFRLCVTCHHFLIEDKGLLVPGQADTLYVVEKCALLGWIREEYPALEPVKRDEQGNVIISFTPFDCPHWEPAEEAFSFSEEEE